MNTFHSSITLQVYLNATEEPHAYAWIQMKLLSLGDRLILFLNHTDLS